MIVLAIDTALENCSVAISDGSDLRLSEQEIGRGHAEVLMPAVESMLRDAGLSAGDLDRIVVSTGPGSFTGLRVGIAAARGLGLAAAVPVVGVSTLAAHAFEAARLQRESNRSPRPIIALLPARADELFGQMFSAEAEPLEPLGVASAEAFAARARNLGCDVAGAGAAMLGEGFLPLHRRSAPSVAALLAFGSALDPASNPPEPVYGKAPDAAPSKGGIARR